MSCYVFKPRRRVDGVLCLSEHWHGALRVGVMLLTVRRFLRCHCAGARATFSANEKSDFGAGCEMLQT